MRSLLPVLFLLGFVPAAGASVPAPGTPVRVTLWCRGEDPPAPVSGADCRFPSRFITVGANGMVTLEVGDSTAFYRLEAIRSLEIRERGSWWPAGGAAGFLAGGAAAYALLHTGGSTSPCDQDANQDAMRTGECIGVAALVGGVPGFGLGALVGSRIRRDRWREVDLRVERVGLVPSPRGGLGVVLVASF